MIKSFLSVSAVSALATAFGPLVQIAPLDGWLAAALFGAACGVGLLGLFRHGASLGGVSIVAVIVQDISGLRAGWILLAWDIALFTLAAFVLAPTAILWSALGALMLNLVIALNHRTDWYIVR